MEMISRGPVAASLLLAPLLLWRAWRVQGKIPVLQPGAAIAELPSLSIIIPARNEAENLRRLLPSLEAIDYPGPLEIIVVDDGSTDETTAVARQYEVTLVQLEKPLPGWLGKTNACHQGASVATGEWLLFTDADTWHAPDGLRQVVTYAVAHGYDALSLTLAQETESRLVRLVMTIAFAALLVGQRQPDALFHGQYILMRREVYWHSGGFAAVRNEALEDLALGHHLHHAGYRASLLRGEMAGSVQIYPGLKQLWPGLTRISSGSLKWAGAAVWLTMLFVTTLMSPLLTAVAWWRGRLRFRWLLAGWGAVVLSLLPWMRPAGLLGISWLAPFAALLIQVAGSWGLLQQRLGLGVGWKGRRV